MLNPFRSDPFEKADRQRQRAEKRHIRAREKAWRREARHERWLDFKKRINNFFAHPFAGRKLSEEERDMRYFKKLAKQDRRIERKKRWNEFRNNPWQTVVNLSRHKLTEQERETRYFKRLAKQDRIAERKKWWAEFKKNPWKTIFPPRRQRDPDGEYVQRMTKQENREFRIHRRKQRIDSFKTIRTTPDLKQKFVFTYLHSSAFFIFSFILIWILYQAVTILVASSYHIPVIWYYYKLKFAISNSSPLYTRTALVTIFAAGPILSLSLGLVFLKLFFTANPYLKRFQLFYLWGFINGCNMFFGAYIAGFLTRTEFIYTSEWIFLSRVFDIEEIIFTSIAFVMLIIIGRIVTPLFMLASGSVTMIKPEFRLFFIISQVILPWITGIIVLFLITLPKYYIPLILKTITPGLILIPVLFLYNRLEFENIHRSGVIQHSYFRWGIVIVSIAILFFYRIILEWGLRLM
jgi:hypothetical protein